MVTAVMNTRLTQGISLRRSLCAKTCGRSLSLAITMARRAVPNNVAFMAEAVDKSAARPISMKPARPRKGLAATARAYSL
ncbi:hypothetical protein BMS3Abin06_00020 [bacterium BMS3Abin06]|nr:hypothetical protein BMS3Abin06_00020 [bacterium BMS3Abin06]